MAALQRSARYLTLDAWRGVAILLVIFYHAASFYLENPASEKPTGAARLAYAIIRRGWLGVPMFFVISGYCISATCDATRRRGGGMREYFSRRIRRIYPPYLIALAITTAAVVVTSALGGGWLLERSYKVLNPASLSVAQWIGNVTLTETWRPRLMGDKGYLVMLHAWSLCYEEQFYIVCGLALLLARRRFFGVLFAIAAVVLPIAVYRQFHPGMVRIDGFFFDGRFLLFAAGVVVYYRVRHATITQARIIDVMAAIAVAVAVFAYRRDHDPGNLGKAVAFLFATALIPLYRWDERVADNLAVRLLAFWGQRCYSLYLLHAPMVGMVSRAMGVAGVQSPVQVLLITLPVCTALSVLVGWVFHWLVERRFLNPPALVAAPVEAAPAPSIAAG